MTRDHPKLDRVGGPARILYVEEDPFVSQVPSRFLLSCGCVVTVAHSAAAAWCHCQPGQDPFDVIIADGDTPSMGGIDLVTRLRSVGNPAAIFVCLVGQDDELIRGFQQLGVKGILRKPLALSDLHECLEAIGFVEGDSRG